MPHPGWQYFPCFPVKWLSVQVLDALFAALAEGLTRPDGGRVEIEHFGVLETQTIDRGENAGTLKSGDAPRYVRGSKKLKLTNQWR